MTRRWLVPLFVTSLVLTSQAHAQELDPTASVQAYITDDPIDPSRLGLATPDGRFAIRLQGGCALSAGINVLIYPNAYMPPWLGLSETTVSQPDCLVTVEGKMDATPCVPNLAGLCDSGADTD